MFSHSRKFVFAVILGTIFFVPVFVQANWSNTADFYVESDYDLFGRDKIEAQLIKTTNKIYFYADKNWYQNFNQKSELDSKIYNLSSDFEYEIYPILTNLLGSEDKPGVDNDSRIIIVLEPLKEDYGGYIRVGDHYLKEDYQLSNQGQIIFLNANLMVQSSLDFLNYELAHEFTHLIILKQKPEVETWFQELIAEATPIILGCDEEDIVLKKRVQSFLYSTKVNLFEWDDSDRNYGKIKLFGLYLIEQFGNDLLVQAVKYPSNNGIESFAGALRQLNIQDNFSDIFMNWLITNVVNNCSEKQEYCYQNESLNNFKVSGETYYLPTKFKASLGGTDFLKNFEGKWIKIVGGLKIVKIKFNLPQETPIARIPYVIIKTNGQKQVGFLDFSRSNISEIYIFKMNEEVEAVYLMPYLFDKNLDSNKLYYYSFEVSSLENNPQIEQQIIEELTRQIEELKRKITSLRLQLAMQKTYQSNPYCSVFSGDMYYGMTSPEVKCLQQFLSNLGPGIYPEGLVTGYFGPLTQAAVRRYQALQNIITTGYFGPLTRAAINKNL